MQQHRLLTGFRRYVAQLHEQQPDWEEAWRGSLEYQGLTAALAFAAGVVPGPPPLPSAGSSPVDTALERSLQRGGPASRQQLFSSASAGSHASVGGSPRHDAPAAAALALLPEHVSETPSDSDSGQHAAHAGRRTGAGHGGDGGGAGHGVLPQHVTRVDTDDGDVPTYVSVAMPTVIFWTTSSM